MWILTGLAQSLAGLCLWSHWSSWSGAGLCPQVSFCMWILTGLAQSLAGLCLWSHWSSWSGAGLCPQVSFCMWILTGLAQSLAGALSVVKALYVDFNWSCSIFSWSLSEVNLAHRPVVRTSSRTHSSPTDTVTHREQLFVCTAPVQQKAIIMCGNKCCSLS